MADSVRMALIGFGTMGRNYARMLYVGMIHHMKLAVVCCRNPEGRKLLAEEFPGVMVCGDTRDLEGLSGEFDAALIVTPHRTHTVFAGRMVALGKHILLDKPADLCAGVVEDLAALCREKGLAFGMIFNNRRLPAFRAAKKMLQEGALGELHRAVWVCNSWYRSPAYHRSAGWRSSWTGEGGGLLINQNVHYLDMWHWLFGMPEKIYADLQFGRYNDFTVDDAADIQFTHPGGFHGTMVSASGEAPGVNRLEIWGSRGRLVVEDGTKLFFDENKMSTVEFARANEVPFGTIPHEIREIPLEECPNPYGEVFENFARHILYGEPLYATGEDGWKTALLTNAAYVSGWEERRVGVPVEERRFLDGLYARMKEEQEET